MNEFYYAFKPTLMRRHPAFIICFGISSAMLHIYALVFWRFLLFILEGIRITIKCSFRVMLLRTSLFFLFWFEGLTYLIFMVCRFGTESIETSWIDFGSRFRDRCCIGAREVCAFSWMISLGLSEDLSTVLGSSLMGTKNMPK